MPEDKDPKETLHRQCWDRLPHKHKPARGGCDFESKGQSQHKDKWLVVSNLRWDTARLQLAGRLETRVMGVFWEEA